MKGRKINLVHYRNKSIPVAYIYNKTDKVLYVQEGLYDDRSIKEILGRDVRKVIYPMLHTKWTK